ncbi:Uncharacterized protein APZ42_021944 [Daphnia magna]|uniref:Reverse transcriptase Ty1/copia-type domain-containing protein n=1 Tax=Daphnia magna TaxID=35525 RepID=A0A164W7C8_9CRUS|nr:Uncharacterized protein APZ42_021944 [Daphnia magna]
MTLFVRNVGSPRNLAFRECGLIIGRYVHRPYIKNRVLSRTSQLTPYDYWNERKPDMTHIRIFGSRAFVRNPTVSSKLEPHSQEGFLVGRCSTQNASRIYIPTTGKIVVSKDVKIDETVLHRDHITKDLLPSKEQLQLAESNEEASMDTRETHVPITQKTPKEDEACPVAAIEDEIPLVTDETLREGSNLPTDPLIHNEVTQETELIIDQDAHDATPLAAEVLQVNSIDQPRRSTRIRARQIQSVAKQAVLSNDPANQDSTLNPTEPETYREAINCPEAEFWIEVINEEYNSLIQNNTWTLCQLPCDRKAIEGKWVLKYKPGFKTTSPRYKARFVIKGFSQINGLDYTETYAPVAKTFSFRMIMSIAAENDLEMIQLDIKTTFLYGTLEEEIYMKHPEGFIIPGKEEEVCRLVKSLYGLKQASRVWNVKFNEFIVAFGLERSKCDPCIYYRYLRPGEPDEEITFFILYVDDGLIVKCSVTKLNKNTWTLCQLPCDRKAIEGKWVLKYKPGFKTTSPRYKARFVIKGFSQIHGLDYTETYAPVAKTFSFRMIMAIAAEKDLEMIQLDIKTTFLYGTLEEEIYMKQPEGFIIPGKEEEVCRLVKSLYGLKQASRVWNVKFNEFIVAFGLESSKCDPCIYYRYLLLIPETQTVPIARDIIFDEYDEEDKNEQIVVPIAESLTPIHLPTQPQDHGIQIYDVTAEPVIGGDSEPLIYLNNADGIEQASCSTRTNSMLFQHVLTGPIHYEFTHQNSGSSDDWRPAILEEYQSLMENDTWEVVPLPLNRKAIKCIWIFSIKTRIQRNSTTQESPFGGKRILPTTRDRL